MTDEPSGYVALFREIMDHPVWKLSPPQFKAFITMLLKANWADGVWVCPQCKERVPVPRGGFSFSPKSIASDAGPGVTKDHVKRALQGLRKCDTITSQGRPRCHACHAFVNYDKFNPTKDMLTQRAPQQRPSSAPAAPTSKPEEPEEPSSTARSGQFLPGLSEDNPLSEAVATSDLLQKLCAESGLDCPGYKTERGYRAKRADWARTLKAAESTLEVSQEDLRAALVWAMTRSPKMEFEDGRAMTWAESIVCADPARKLVKKYHAILAHKRRAGPQRSSSVEYFGETEGAQ